MNDSWARDNLYSTNLRVLTCNWCVQWVIQAKLHLSVGLNIISVNVKDVKVSNRSMSFLCLPLPLGATPLPILQNVRKTMQQFKVSGDIWWRLVWQGVTTGCDDRVWQEPVSGDVRTSLRGCAGLLLGTSRPRSRTLPRFEQDSSLLKRRKSGSRVANRSVSWPCQTGPCTMANLMTSGLV